MVEAGISDIESPALVGLGFRQSFAQELLALPELNADIDFLEVVAENYIGVGGLKHHTFQQIAERWPLVCHGLGLNLGGTDPLDTKYLLALRAFLDTYNINFFSDHMCYSANGSQLYMLMPLAFTEEMVVHLANRIKQAQDILGRRIAIENISYYALPNGYTMSEGDFINAVLQESDCALMLDINNVYVNAHNHKYSAEGFLQSLNVKHMTTWHMAGHRICDDGSLLDTHGATICQGVIDLWLKAQKKWGPHPVVIERDNNIPSLATLMQQLADLRSLQQLEVAHV